MRALQVGDEPVVNAWLRNRRAMGVDGRDEIWEGVYHVAPYEHARNSFVMSALLRLLQPAAEAAGLVSTGPFNLGVPGDFRIPDAGLHRTRDWALYLPTAAVVVEVLSPGDETWGKLDFYASRLVDEVWVVDPLARSVSIQRRGSGGYEPVEASDVLGLSAREVEDGLDWP